MDWDRLEIHAKASQVQHYTTKPNKSPPLKNIEKKSSQANGLAARCRII